MRSFLLHDVTLHEGTGAPSRSHQSLLVRDGRIAEICDAKAVPPLSPDVQRYDLAGKVVMAGMIFAHMHIAYVDVVESRDTMFKYRLPQLTMLAAGNARKALECGYTTAVGAGSVAGIDQALARGMEAGLIKGPRFVPCSRDLMCSGPIERRNPEVKGRIPPELMRIADTAEEMVRFTEAEIQEGAQVIKTFATGDDAFPNARSKELLFTLDELKAVVATAHARGVRVRTHARGLQGIRNAVEAKTDIIDHATYADEAILERIAANGQFLVPSLYQPMRMLSEGLRCGKTPEAMARLEFQQEVENTLRFLPLAERMGIPIAAGEDFGFAWTPHGTYSEELICYVEKAGFAPATVLKWACANGARMIGRSADLGAVAPGRLADLLVLSRDPSEDITVLRDPKNIEVVMQGGLPQLSRLRDLQPEAAA